LNDCIILGLDISTRSTGWSVVEYKSSKQNLIAYGTITRKKMDMGEMLVFFEQELEQIISLYNPTVISAEAPFVGSNKKTIQQLSMFHGVMQLIVKKHKLSIIYYSVMTLKSKVLGGVKLKKADGTKKTGDEMKQEVSDKIHEMFQIPERIENNDITDSISACVTYIYMDGKPIEKKKKVKK
jgi:crossover junction endodeoxyribonuclease RuvC